MLISKHGARSVTLPVIFIHERANAHLLQTQRMGILFFCARCALATYPPAPPSREGSTGRECRCGGTRASKRAASRLNATKRAFILLRSLRKKEKNLKYLQRTAPIFPFGKSKAATKFTFCCADNAALLTRNSSFLGLFYPSKTAV